MVILEFGGVRVLCPSGSPVSDEHMNEERSVDVVTP
jgi:two-component system phosphoglycerate transport system sensor histidine kinase PgtB